MTLRADVKLNLCRSKSQCETVRLTPELQLQPGHTRDSSVATYVRMMSGFLRPQQQSELKIGSFSLKEMQTGGQVLTLTVDSPETIESFNIFVGNDAGLAFERPRVRIDGSRATVRLLPLDDKSDAEGKEFEITIEANRKYVLRQTLSPVRGNAPEPDRRNLLTAMFAAAVIGGLLLNFMPCVFPVLSLKLLSLTKFGARNVSSVRRSFAFTLLGIWLSFALLAVMLAGLKQLGENVGWGMQFQNPWFVSLIFLPSSFCRPDMGYRRNQGSPLRQPHDRQRKPSASFSDRHLCRADGHPLHGALSRHRDRFCPGRKLC